MKSPTFLIRPLVRDLHAYVPGEQPKIKGLIKLNTNENPYPPSPKVLAAVKAAVDGRLRLYPNPTAQALREKLAKLHGCRADNIIVGNGSDELLALATRAFVEPKSEQVQSPKSKGNGAVFHAELFAVSGAGGHSWRGEKSRAAQTGFQPAERGGIEARRHLGFQRGTDVCDDAERAERPRLCKTAELEKLCRAQKGVVVLDEAYVDFAEENAMKLALKFPHVLVARTFSKAYSLCFQRVGYFVGHPELIAALHKIRDSYNVNGLGQVAAEATLDDLKYYRANFKKIIATREWLSRELTKLGFRVFPSQTNFILARAAAVSRRTEWLQKLRGRKILVRWFNSPEVKNYLRITIGTPAEAEALVKASESVRINHARSVSSVNRKNLLFPALTCRFLLQKPACIWNSMD